MIFAGECDEQNAVFAKKLKLLLEDEGEDVNSEDLLQLRIKVSFVYIKLAIGPLFYAKLKQRQMVACNFLKYISLIILSWCSQ